METFRVKLRLKSNVVNLPQLEKRSPVKFMAEIAEEYKPQEVVMVGVADDGCEFTAASTSSAMHTLWYLQRATLSLLQKEYGPQIEKSSEAGVVVPFKSGDLHD